MNKEIQDKAKDIMSRSRARFRMEGGALVVTIDFAEPVSGHMGMWASSRLDESGGVISGLGVGRLIALKGETIQKTLDTKLRQMLEGEFK